jgi:hypothetical protein
VRKWELKKKTSKVFEVSGSTLGDKGNSKKTAIEELINTRLGRKPTMPCDLDEEVVSYCLMMERKYFRLTASSIKRMTFELAIIMDLPSIFSTTRKRRLEVFV